MYFVYLVKKVATEYFVTVLELIRPFGKQTWETRLACLKNMRFIMYQPGNRFYINNHLMVTELIERYSLRYKIFIIEDKTINITGIHSSLRRGKSQSTAVLPDQGNTTSYFSLDTIVWGMHNEYGLNKWPVNKVFYINIF